MSAATTPCTKCRDNFPMPVAMDYFDQRVIADYTQRRTACTIVSDAEKPCLRPVLAAPTTTPTLADFDAWAKAEEQRLLDAMDAAVAADDASTYEAHHAQFVDLAGAFDALWKFKTAMRSANTPATSASKKA